MSYCVCVCCFCFCLFVCLFSFHFNTTKQREELNDRTQMIITKLSLKKPPEQQQQQETKQQQITHAKNQIYTKLHDTGAHTKTLVVTPQV